jgi:hypothetical protein
VYDTKYKMFMCLELVTGGELLERLMDQGAYTEHDACELFAKVPAAAASAATAPSYTTHIRFR